jgi:competence protein ComEC
MGKVGNIIFWILSIFLLLMSFGSSGVGIIIGILGAIAINPMILKLLLKINFNAKIWMRVVAFFVSFIIVIAMAPHTNNLIKNVSVKSNSTKTTSSQNSVVNSNISSIISGAGQSSSITSSLTSSKTADNSTGSPLTVSYIDVGQGDSILIQSPNGKNMLIDAGESTAQTAVYNYLKGKGVKKIDVLVATHPHADHIGGMAYIINNFEIGSIYMTKVTTTTKTYETLLTTIKSKGLSINTAKAGVTIALDSALTVIMVAPVGSSYTDLNNYSAVIKITYNKNSFLFAGDAGNDSEQEILNSGANIKADVLKVGHHGSATSTSISFLKAVSPKYAVISVGKGNSYGHPTQSALDRLNAAGAKIYRTDDGGTVAITSDGQNITVNRNTSNYNSQAPPQSTVVTQPTSQISPVSSAITNNGDVIVYKTNTGAKYHLDGCSSLSKSKIPIKLSDAKAAGLTACGICHPPQ